MVKILKIIKYALLTKWYTLTKQNCVGCQYLKDVLYTHSMCQNCVRLPVITDNYCKG